MVGRLIEQQDLWRVSKEYREGEATLLADAEFLHGSVVVAPCDQAECAKRHLLGPPCTDQIRVRVERGAAWAALVRVRQFGLLREEFHPVAGRACHLT